MDSVVQPRQSDAATAARRTTASRLFEVKIAACSNDRAAQDARRADPALQRQPCARPKLTASLDAVLGLCSLHTSGSEQLPTNASNIYVRVVDLSCPDLHKCKRYSTRKTARSPMQAATARQVQHEKQLQGEPSKLTVNLPVRCCSWSVLPCKPRATRRERACANKHECLLEEVFRKPMCDSKHFDYVCSFVLDFGNPH